MEWNEARIKKRSAGSKKQPRNQRAERIWNKKGGGCFWGGVVGFVITIIRKLPNSDNREAKKPNQEMSSIHCRETDKSPTSITTEEEKKRHLEETNNPSGTIKRVVHLVSQNS